MQTVRNDEKRLLSFIFTSIFLNTEKCDLFFNFIQISFKFHGTRCWNDLNLGAQNRGKYQITLITSDIQTCGRSIHI